MLKTHDRDVLEKISNVTDFTGNIFDVTQKDGRRFSYLRICRKGMAEDLFALGMARRNKTFNTSMPTIPGTYFWDFVRGVTEGDGNLNHGARWNDLTITIASATYQFVVDLKSALEQYGIFTTIRTRQAKGNTRELYMLVTKSNADALRWCFLMYKNTDTSLRLDRKFEIFRNYVDGYYDRKRRSTQCIEIIDIIRANIPECAVNSAEQSA